MRGQEGYALRWWGLTQSRPKGQDTEEARRRAMESLHKEHLAAVFSYVSRRVPDRQDAEDVTAEVFAAAFAGLAKQRNAEAAYPWLLGIARRKVADLVRRKTRSGGRTAALTEAVPMAAATGPEAMLDQSERARRLQALLSGLPDDQREALLLHYMEELPQIEVAAVLGRSPAAVNSLLQRARASVYRAGHGYFLGESGVESEANS